MSWRWGIRAIAVTVTLVVVLMAGAGLAHAAIGGDRVTAAVAYTPSLSGSRLAYIDWADGVCRLRIKDLSDGSDIVVPDQAGPRWRPAIDGTRVVFEDHTSREVGGNPSLAMYDMTTGKIEILSQDVAGHFSPSISGDRVAYEHRLLHGPGSIVVMDLRTGTETAALDREADQADPAIYGDRLVWVERDQDGSSIFTTTLGSSDVTTVAAEAGYNDRPAIYGDTVVYTWWPKAEGKGLGELWVYNIKTGARTQLTDGAPACSAPSLSTDTLVWECYDGSKINQSYVHATTLDLAALAAAKAPGSATPDLGKTLRAVARLASARPSAWFDGLGAIVVSWSRVDILGIWTSGAR